MARHVRVTPRKARRVVDMIRGMPAEEAQAVLQFAPQAASERKTNPASGSFWLSGIVYWFHIRNVVAAIFVARMARPPTARDFGLVPDFRAGLHCGPVAVGELGYLKKEIALIGDTMNAAARIVEACGETENRVLASAALLDRLAALPPGVTRRRLGELAVRGKERPLELCVLEVDGE